MSIPPSPSAPDVDASPSRERLESWKEIATYLNRSVRTLHRWEKDEGLPVHRQLHKELGSVFAYKSELDAWSRARSVRADVGENRSELTSGSPNRSRLVITVALAGAVALIGAFAYLVAGGFREERPGEATNLASLELISTFSGSHRWPSLSPDGQRLAFVSDVGGTPQVWIKTLAAADPVQLTFGEVPAFRPRWSPQGDRIVYSTVGNGIWSVPTPGGEPRQIISDGRNADLSRDGRRLVFERAGEIFIAGADGSGPSVLPRRPKSLNPHYGDSWPTFSPDGESIALFLAEEGRYGDYWILPANGETPRRITADVQEGGAPAWTPDGASLVIRSARAGSMNLWRVSVADGTLERLTSGAGDDFDPTVSPDGRTVLFANVKRTWEVIVQGLRGGPRRTVLARRALVVFPRFSVDGRRIALAGRNARGDTHLFVIDADGSNLTAVTGGAGELNILPQWAGDGDSLYFYQVRPTQTFRRVSVSGGPSREIAPWSFGHQFQASVDRRERIAVYSSVEHGALQQSRLRNLESGSETGLPFALYEQRLSHDGRLIAGESRDHELLICEVSGGCRPLTPKAGHGLTALAWSADSRRLIYLRHTSKRVWGELTSISVDGGAETVHGLVGPFEHDFQMFMDASPRDEIVFALCREAPYELWQATLR
jgi:Tol biopolymer transport system component